MDDFSKYELLRAEGKTPVEAWLEAQEEGLDFCARIRMARKVFGLTLVEAKEVCINATTSRTLDEHQEVVAEELRQAFESDDITIQLEHMEPKVAKTITLIFARSALTIVKKEEQRLLIRYSGPGCARPVTAFPETAEAVRAWFLGFLDMEQRQLAENGIVFSVASPVLPAYGNTPARPASSAVIWYRPVNDGFVICIKSHDGPTVQPHEIPKHGELSFPTEQRHRMMDGPDRE